MSDAVSFLLDHGSYAALFAALLATGVGVPVSEDLVLLAAGALSHRNSASLGLTLAVALAGIFSGDLFLFLG
ncbi:MAG TPA: DedA family protein, partial [Planctomycetota bacterium]|nr:DedA family protein [Planctomycetota bacterium]